MSTLVLVQGPVLHELLDRSHARTQRGVLYPAFGWLLSPMVAAAAMALPSVSVIVNALRLRTQRLG